MISVEDVATAVRDTLGRSLVVAQVDPHRAAAELARQGVAAAVIPMIAITEANQRDGRFEVGAGAVERLTGRPPLPLSAFFRAHAETLLARSPR